VLIWLSARPSVHAPGAEFWSDRPKGEGVFQFEAAARSGIFAAIPSINKLFTPTNSPRTAQDADAQLRKVGAGMYMSSRLPNGFDLRT
jgi:hypothetical protein